MSSLRVYQLAKQMGVSSKELVNLLQDNGVEVRNHMSVLDDDTVEIVRQTFQAHVADAAEVDEGKSADDDDEAGRKKKKKGRKGAVKKGKMLEYEEGMTVRNLADKLTIAPSIAVSDIISLGHMLSINHPVPFELAREVAKKHGVEIIEAVDLMVEEEMVEEEPEELVSRPPVVTVMGHVDHGKTTLLDAIRETHVADREAGGITQHIGASVADVNGQRIVFVDTPGHEAFTAMRSRGAQVTDLVILVVAADDGLMPQTIEAINHSKAAGVPIVVAINKIDKPGINMDRIKQDLAKHDLLPEEWGGQTTICEVSAKTRQGLGNLLEMVLLNAELLELKANPTAPARGVVLESRLDKGQGSVAAILVQKGTLRIGDPFVIGATYGKVRAMINAQGKRIKEAGPATPVEVLGLCGIAQAGDPFQVVENEREAKVIAETRRESAKERDRINSQKITFEDLFSRIQEGTVKDFNIILKGDVQGACEAVNAALEKLSTDKVKVSVLHSGVGAISENDVMLASSSNATVVGFNVKMEPNVPVVAKREKIQIRNYKVIYELLDDVRKAMEGMLDPIKTEVRMGMAIVRQVFSISRLGTIAGCYVQDGKVERNAVAKVFREDEEIHCGQIGSLKRFKDDVREVGTGFECGIGIDGFDEFAEGDKIEVYRIEETKGCL